MQEYKNQDQEGGRKESNGGNNQDVIFSRRIKAGKRTYFFDVKATLSNDYFITITESKRKHGNHFIRHKIYLYKEDFNKFAAGLEEVVNHIKTELLPDYDYEKFDNRDEDADEYSLSLGSDHHEEASPEDDDEENSTEKNY